MPSKSQRQHDLMRACLDPAYREQREKEGKRAPDLETCLQFLQEDREAGLWQEMDGT